MDEFKVTTTFARCHNQINQLENNNNSKASKPKGDAIQILILKRRASNI